MKKSKRIVPILFTVIVLCIFFKATDVDAVSVSQSYSFDFRLAPNGGHAFGNMFTDKGKTNYVKVTLWTTGGDNYDVRYGLNNSDAYRQIAEKKGLHAAGDIRAVYFIPKDGYCPGLSSECVTVYPDKDGFITADSVAQGYVTYCIYLYNGSIFGGTLDVHCLVEFFNY